ncbi:hypothetical protein EYF80_017445 [Liparis tanakae]|uniref:Uncharacterized protein n=1 Tax=Liparis tanakae TaxID=230148 RepID=A0A4Z2I4Y1_9TELE|nr:hypothetical protein EYF80_017445 [Liparis tanakae]
MAKNSFRTINNVPVHIGMVPLHVPLWVHVLTGDPSSSIRYPGWHWKETFCAMKGCVPDHVPLGKHILSEEPIRSKPSEQLNELSLLGKAPCNCLAMAVLIPILAAPSRCLNMLRMLTPVRYSGKRCIYRGFVEK